MAAIAAYLGLGAGGRPDPLFAPNKPASEQVVDAKARRSKQTKRCRSPPNYPQNFRARTAPHPIRARKCPDSSRFLTWLTKR